MLHAGQLTRPVRNRCGDGSQNRSGDDGKNKLKRAQLRTQSSLTAKPKGAIIAPPTWVANGVALGTFHTSGTRTILDLREARGERSGIAAADL